MAVVHTRLSTIAAAALGVVLLAPAGGSAVRSPAPGGEALEGQLDLPTLMKRIRQVQRLDFESWADFAFDRHVVRQRLAADGQVMRSETLEFEVLPKGKDFDEVLRRIDGRQPSSSEVSSHRRAGRFAKHYGRVRAGEDVDDEQGFSLAWLVQFPSYEVSRSEQIAGRKCLRLDFGPSIRGENSGGPSRVPSRFLEVMAGSLWIDEDSHHLVRAEARTLEPVPLTFGVVRILDLQVSLDAAPVAASAWLPSRISVDSRLSVLGREVRKRNVFTYSRFRRERP